MTDTTLSPSDLLDEREAARLYTLAVATLRNWRALKQGPRYVKLGKRTVRYRRSDLEAFVSSSQAEGGLP